MSIDVTFLGQAYSFGDDLKEYVEAMRLSEEIVDRAMQAFLTVAKKNNGFIDAVDLKPHLIKVADAFIKRLCNKGVFSRSAEDYVDENEGYRQIQQICEEGTSVYRNILVDEINEFQDGMNDAYADAASNITGSGVRVFTSSLTTLALTSAYEYSVLKGQAKKADEQYKKAIDALSDRTEARSNQRKNEYLEKIYFPKMTDAITLFSYTLSQKYIEDLISEGKFDDTVFENVQIKKSNNLLENLKHISNNNSKMDCIKQAFEVCPFNEGIFYAIIELDSWTDDIYKCAKYFGLTDRCIEYAESKISIKHISSFSSELRKQLKYIKAYAQCKYVDPAKCVNNFTKNIYDQVIISYKSILDFSTENPIYKSLVSLSDESFLLLDEKKIRENVTDYIYSIISNNDFNILTAECGHNELPAVLSTFLHDDENYVSKDKIDRVYTDKVFDWVNKEVYSRKLKIENNQIRNIRTTKS
ncbi:MAG: hypothetical protein IK990_04200 [Ruminiclostridium sp.]|nr:hypothetical protein [Ruminiclostridium sp.]